MEKIPIAVPNLSEREQENLTECIQTNWVSSGGLFVEEFETRVAEIAGTEQAVATSTGTSALHLALLEAGVSEDDLVLLPSFTFIASANAISYCGADPWLIDINRSLLMDPDGLKRALENKTVRREQTLVHEPTGRRVSAIMPVHTLGHPADMKPINQVADRFGLPVVADGAAALGTKYRGREIGTVADFTTFSFNGNKTVTCGGGGAVVGKEPTELEHIKHRSTTARPGPEYDHDEIGYNYRMTNLEAAVGCAQLEKLQEFIRKKRRIQERYNEALGELDAVSPYAPPDYGTGGYWYSLVKIENSELSMERIYNRLNQNNIESGPFWKPIHLQQPYREAPMEQLSVVEGIWDRLLVLPCSTGLTREEQELVIEAVTEILTE